MTDKTEADFGRIDLDTNIRPDRRRREKRRLPAYQSMSSAEADAMLEDMDRNYERKRGFSE